MPNHDALRALRRQWATAAATALLAIALVTMIWRMLQGVDFLDEAFYLAIPARFAFGDRPFVDDLSVAQTTGLLMYPVVKAYLALFGSTGIFLFVRVLYLALFACVGWSAYAMARPHVSRPAAILVGTACLCYLPYSLPGLGYNTLCIALFSISLFHSARWLLDEAAPPCPLWRHPIFWAGFLLAAACFAYPTQPLTAVAAVACVIALARGRRVHAFTRYAAGGLVFAILVSPILISAGLGGLRDMIHYTSGDSPSGGFAPAVMLARLAGFARLHPELPLSAGVALAGAIAVRFLPRAVGLVMIGFPLLACGSTLLGYVGSIGFVASFGAVAPLLALGVAERRPALVLAVGVAVPSLVAGMVWSLSSTNLEMAAGVGLFPGAIVGGLLLAMLVGRAATVAPRLAPAQALAPAMLVGLLLGYILDGTAYYGDGPRALFTERIGAGPYWGLATTAQKRAQLEELTADLIAYRGRPGSRIYCNLPAAYLIAERSPLVGAVWIFPAPTRLGRDAQLLLANARPGELIVRAAYEPALFSQLLEATSDLVVRRERYEVRVYRGFGKTAAAAAKLQPLAFDEWFSIGTEPPGPPTQPRAIDGVFAFGWSWPEEWGRWGLSTIAGLAVPRPEVPAGGTTLELHVLPYLPEGVDRQRYRIRLEDKLLAEGVVSGEGGVIEVALPVSAAPLPTIYLTLELPDARPASDGRGLSLGLRRLRILRTGAPPPSPAP